MVSLILNTVEIFHFNSLVGPRDNEFIFVFSLGCVCSGTADEKENRTCFV